VNGEREDTAGINPAARPELPPHGRLLGVDYGHVRVGLAVSDPDRIIASPLDTYTRQGDAADAAYFAKLAAAEKVAGLVVGLPLHTGGEEGQKAAEARRFGAWLAGVTGLPVVFWDERFTTSLAEDALWDAGLSHRKRRDRRDRVAAQLILQAFIEAGCPPEGTRPDSA
jgi:putative Holliday junction resolvase